MSGGEVGKRTWSPLTLRDVHQPIMCTGTYVHTQRLWKLLQLYISSRCFNTGDRLFSRQSEATSHLVYHTPRK
eukprot:5222020-Amphidinium_carterae.1